MLEELNLTKDVWQLARGCVCGHDRDHHDFTRGCSVCACSRWSPVLTEIQLQVLELRERHGFSWHMIALNTGRGHSTVRGHYRAAIHNVHRTMQNGT